MDQLFLALALAASGHASLTPVETASQAAVQIFNEACVHGQLRLTPERGRILTDDEVKSIPFADELWPTYEMKKHVTVKFNYPPQTYLVTIDFNHLQPHSITTQCLLISGSLTKYDAMAALMSTAPGVDPFREYVGYTEWGINQPKLGFESRMWVREDQSIILEVDVRNKPTQQSDPTKH